MKIEQTDVHSGMFLPLELFAMNPAAPDGAPPAADQYR